MSSQDNAELPIIPDSSGGRISSAAAYAEPVTPDLAFTASARGLWVGGVGDVGVLMAGSGSLAVFAAVPAGTLLPISCTEVVSGSTTATLMVALI